MLITVARAVSDTLEGEVEPNMQPFLHEPPAAASSLQLPAVATVLLCLAVAVVTLASLTGAFHL